MDAGYCGPIVCYTHDGVPMTVAEEEDWDGCVSIIRPYECSIEKTAVETNHPPSNWRKTFDNRN
jgi:hypothetical protein